MKFRLLALPDLDRLRKAPQIFYSVASCWWSDQIIYTKPVGMSLPCDSRGGLLMQTEEKGGGKKFIEAAESEPSAYGKHGMNAFRAAFHGVVEVQTADGRGWRPTCFAGWEKYNELLDKADPLTGEYDDPVA